MYRDRKRSGKMKSPVATQTYWYADLKRIVCWRQRCEGPWQVAVEEVTSLESTSSERRNRPRTEQARLFKVGQ